MVLKRTFGEGVEAGSEFSGPDCKRGPAFANASILRNVNRTSLQEFGYVLEPLLRKWVNDEVQQVLSSFLRPSLTRQNGSSRPRISQLHFEEQLPPMIFTGCRVESEHNSPVKIVLRDSSSRKIITSGPLSSAKVNIVVLDGDFNTDEREDWDEGEFTNKSIREREGKRPLVTGTLSIALREGIGYVEDITFTDNSSWIRCGKFRLGAKMQDVTVEANVREGISNSFKVKDHRGESYKKHHPPSALDEVWRLEKIAKDGASHKKLASHGISTVKKFLQLYVSKPLYLRHILGKISNKSWDTIIKHAAECCLDEDELYLYKAGAELALIFNSIYQVVGATFDGQNYQSPDTFNPYQKGLVDSLKLRVYAHIHESLGGDLLRISGQAFSACPLILSSLQANSDSSQSSSLQNINFPLEQDEIELHMSGEQMTIPPIHANRVQHGNHFQVSVVEDSHQMEDLGSMWGNGFATGHSGGGFYTGKQGGNTTVSLGPLGLNDPIAIFNENFQVDTPAWQGSSFFVTPRNQELDVVSSNFGIHFSGNGKSKASWCKIRAVIKWQMVKSSCQKNGKSSKCRF